MCDDTAIINSKGVSLGTLATRRLFHQEHWQLAGVSTRTLATRWFLHEYWELDECFYKSIDYSTVVSTTVLATRVSHRPSATWRSYSYMSRNLFLSQSIWWFRDVLVYLIVMCCFLTTLYFDWFHSLFFCTFLFL